MIGRPFAHYQIQERIGSGGMAVVYRARDTRLGRDVALKVLPTEAPADPMARSRLLREARTASALSHPHICTVFDVGEIEGIVYIAMELVPGRSLQEVLTSGPLPAETAARYTIQVADALAHAHERGVIHRDLKSANVMVTSEGRVKVLDFGLARFDRLPAGTHARNGGAEPGELPASLRLTPEGMMVGTPYALPPEVLKGAEADARGDVWSLGILLYELLAGRPPFTAGTLFEVSAAILSEPVPPLPAQVPPGLGSIVTRCLHKETSRRYQRASEVLAALEAAESSGLRPIPNPTPGPDRRRFEELMLPHLAAVHRLAVKLTGDAASAEDLVQETYLKALKSFASLREHERARSWLFQILSRLAIDRHRSREREMLTDDVEQLDRFSLYDLIWEEDPSPYSDNPHDHLLAQFRDEEVRAALRALPDEYRIPLVLLYAEEMTYKELAAILSCPLGTVMSRLHRGRKILERELWECAKRRGLVKTWVRDEQPR